MDLMKMTKFFLLLTLALTFLSGAARADEGPAAFSPAVIRAIRTTLEQCLVRPYGYRKDGERVLGFYQSTCPGVIRDGRTALVPLSAEENSERGWEVRLLGSEYGDNGDLWDVAVWDEQGHLVLEAQRVLAFGDPLEALSILTGAHPQAALNDPSLDEAE